MSDRNYYALLGVRRTADLAEIRDAYVRRLKSVHPDLKQPTNLPRPRVEDLQRAYQCLRDTEARSHHDAELLSAERARHARTLKMHRRLAAKQAKRGIGARPARSGAAVAKRWRRLLLAALLALVAIQLAKYR